MLKWPFHQYSGYKKPFVWHTRGVTPAGRVMYEFVRGVPTRRSVNDKFGDFEFAITEPGLYKVGNTKDENGYRFVFLHNDIWRYRSLYDEADAIKVARKLQAGETIEDLSDELIDLFKWHSLMNITHSNLKPALQQTCWLLSMAILGILTIAAYLIGFTLNVLSVILGGFTVMSAASDRDARESRHASARRRSRG